MATKKVGANLRFVRSRAERALDGVRFDPHGSGIPREMCVVERLGRIELMREENVMHRPEASRTRAIRCELGYLGGVERVRVNPGVGKVPEHETHSVRELDAQCTENGVGAETLCALEVAVLYQHDRCVEMTDAMILIVDGGLKPAELCVEHVEVCKGV